MSNDVTDRLTTLYAQRKSSRIALNTIKALLADPTSPATVFRSFGTQAAIDGDSAIARRMVEKSLAMEPDDAMGLNNYAWLLANTEPVDLTAAFKVVNKALLFAPNNPRMRETRGQIHFARQEWQLAIQDLEFALRNMPSEKQLHKTLATAYEKLGNRDLAGMHASQAD